MEPRAPCDTVLLVTQGDSSLIDTLDALRDDGVGVLLVRHLDRALAAMQSGLRPDVVLVDLAFGPARFAPFLHGLLDEPALRALPVIGVPDSGTSLFQLFPRDRARELPFPADHGQLQALLQVVCSDAQLARAGAHP